MTSWKTYKLGDVVNILDNRRIPLSAREREQRHGEYPYYGAQGIIDYVDEYLFDGTYLLIAEDGENLRSKKQNIAQLVSGKYWVNNHAHILESNGLCDIRYICYLLNIIDISGYITGSAQPKLNQANLLAISISLPPLEEQRRIAGILGAIDDKIENNRRINTNLELQAQALYKQWFVDNRSDDWKTKKLSEFFNVVTGKKDANFSTKDGAYPFFTCSQDVLKAPDYSFEGAAILLAGNGDFNVKRYIGKFEAYQRTYVLIPFDRKYHSFLYLTIKHYLQEITGGSRGSVIKFITKGNIADFEVALPQMNIDDKLAVLDSLYQTIDRNTAENHNLATLRNTLLPKLMNGEIKL